MSPRALGFVAAAVLGAVLILLIHLGSRVSVEPARQYQAIVNGIFISKGWLTLEPPPEDTGRGESGLPQLTINWSQVDTGDQDLARRFYLRSYLPKDIDRFNHPYSAADRSQFVIREREGTDRLRGLALGAHEFRSPLHPANRWLGRLCYGSDTPRAARCGGTSAADEGAVAAALILQPAQSTGTQIVLTPLEARYDHYPGKPVKVFEQGKEEVVTDALIHLVDRHEHLLASLWRVKNEVLLETAGLPEEEKFEIRINGRRLSNASGAINVLPPGSQLAFKDVTARVSVRPGRARLGADRHREVVWTLGDFGSPDPIYDSATGIWRNSTQNPLFARVVDALNAVAAQQGKDLTTPVTLTLSREMETEAGDILESRLTRTNGGAPLSPSSVAAVTLMDATSGRLLALPSLPVPPDLSGKPGATIYREDVQRENHNFTRLPVGSVAKVLLGAAILQSDLKDFRQPGAGGHAYPAPLLTMQLAPSGPSTCNEPKEWCFDSVLGISLGRPPGVHDEVTGWLDLQHALAWSINRYALTLLTLAATRPEERGSADAGTRELIPEGDRVKIGGQVLTQRPATLVFDPGYRGSFRITNLAWVGAARNLYGINTTSAEESSQNAARDYLWDGLPCEIRPEPHSALLATISPETENLRLEAIQTYARGRDDYRGRYLPLILGDGESRWSAVALAEAFASLVQNERIQASLTPGERGCAPREKPRWPALLPEVQKALTEGMRMVVSEERGTAHLLERPRRLLAEAACKQQKVFTIFGKTGSPELADVRRAPEAALLEKLGREKVLFLDPDLGPGVRAILYRREDGRTEKVADPLVRELQNDIEHHPRSKAAGELRKYFQPVAGKTDCGVRSPRLLWRNIFREVEAYNLGPAAQNNVRVEGGQLYSDEQCYVKPASGHGRFGKHFAFVAAVYDQAATGGTSCSGGVPEVDVTRFKPEAGRAIAGVVAVQDAGIVARDKLVSVRTAGELLCGPIAQRLGLTVNVADCRASLK